MATMAFSFRQHLTLVSNDSLVESTYITVPLNHFSGEMIKYKISSQILQTCQHISSLPWALRLLAHWLNKQRQIFKSLQSNAPLMILWLSSDFISWCFNDRRSSAVTAWRGLWSTPTQPMTSSKTSTSVPRDLVSYSGQS